MTEEPRVLRFRIIYGYGTNDYISITENELEKAQYCWIKNAVFTHGRQIKGGEFKRIEEDYRYYTGWHDTFSPKDSEDMAQITRDMPPKRIFDERLELARVRAQYAIETNQPNLLGTPEKLDVLRLK